MDIVGNFVFIIINQSILTGEENEKSYKTYFPPLLQMSIQVVVHKSFCQSLSEVQTKRGQHFCYFFGIGQEENKNDQSQRD